MDRWDRLGDRNYTSNKRNTMNDIREMSPAICAENAARDGIKALTKTVEKLATEVELYRKLVIELREEVKGLTNEQT